MIVSETNLIWSSSSELKSHTSKEVILISVTRSLKSKCETSSPHISGSYSIRMFVPDSNNLNTNKPVVGSSPSSYISSPPIEPK